MEVWDRLPRDVSCRNTRDNPSFSSSLLDSIYRSMDGPDGAKVNDDQTILRKKASRRRQAGNAQLKEEELTNFRRHSMIEKWMEKKDICEKIHDRRKSLPEGKSAREVDSVFFSSDSVSCFSMPSAYPLPIRTGTKPVRISLSGSLGSDESISNSTNLKPKRDGGLDRTKSKARKIYSDLKKVRPPISPGGRVTSFFNSIFPAKHTKKTKISSHYADKTFKSEPPSACSSASSFSRYRLSRTPSSGLNLTSTAGKRSVGFQPVPTTVHDEELRSYGRSENQRKASRNISNNELEYFHIVEENRRAVRAAKHLLTSQKKKELDMFDVCSTGNAERGSFNREDGGDAEEDDAVSYASSDLFELECASAMDVGRYHRELPVYETTRFDTDRGGLLC